MDDELAPEICDSFESLPVDLLFFFDLAAVRSSAKLKLKLLAVFFVSHDVVADSSPPPPPQKLALITFFALVVDSSGESRNRLLGLMMREEL